MLSLCDASTARTVDSFSMTAGLGGVSGATAEDEVGTWLAWVKDHEPCRLMVGNESLGENSPLVRALVTPLCTLCAGLIAIATKARIEAGTANGGAPRIGSPALDRAAEVIGLKNVVDDRAREDVTATMSPKSVGGILRAALDRAKTRRSAGRPYPRLLVSG